MSAREKGACLIGFGLEAGLMLLAWVRSGGVHDPQRDVALFCVTSVLYLAGLALMCRLQGGIRPTFLLGWALVFRLTAFCMDPLFSDDLYRYRWEGRVAAAGLNPYDHRPAGPGLGALLEERVDGKDFKPVYGPLLETLQWGLVVLGGGSLLAMKLGACLAELGLCWLLWQWVEEKWRWMAWGWCPLGIVEFWGMGHHDAVMAAFGDPVHAVRAALAMQSRIVCAPSKSVSSLPRACSSRSVKTWPRSGSAASWISSIARKSTSISRGIASTSGVTSGR